MNAQLKAVEARLLSIQTTINLKIMPTNILQIFDLFERTLRANQWLTRLNRRFWQITANNPFTIGWKIAAAVGQWSQKVGKFSVWENIQNTESALTDGRSRYKPSLIFALLGFSSSQIKMNNRGWWIEFKCLPAIKSESFRFHWKLHLFAIRISNEVCIKTVDEHQM